MTQPRKRPIHSQWPRMTLAGTAVVAIAAVALRGPAVVAEGKPGIDPAVLQAQVNERFGLRRSELLSLDVDAGPGESFKVDLSLNGMPVSLDLHPHSVLADGYRLLVQGEDGAIRDVEPGAPTTFRGTVEGMPGSGVSGGFSADGTIQAMIHIDDDSEYVLESLTGRLPGLDVGADQYVLYDRADVNPTDAVCGMVHELDNFIPDGQGILAGDGVFFCAELACDADVEYYQDWGSDVAQVESRIQLVLNTVNIQYENQVDISHIITAIVVRTAEPDPYNSTDSFGRLNEFRNEWLLNFDDIPRDVAHLFTGANINGGTIGRAWTIGGICTDDAYCFSESDFNGSFGCATDLTAHELGHLWNAFHCACPSHTMNPSITCANNFTAGSVASIIGHRDSRSCLTQCSGATTALPFSDMFETLTLDPDLWLGVDGTEVNDEGLNPPSAPFALNLEGTDEIRSARMNAGNVIELVLSYEWQRTGGGNEPEAGEDLIVEFEDTNLNWIEVNRHPGSGPNMTTFDSASLQLPSQAFHSSFRFRFRNGSPNPGFDDYYVDDVVVTGIVQAENDACDNALLVGSDVPIDFSTLGATPDGFDESGVCGFDPENDVWYRAFAICESGVLRLTVSDSDYDHAISVYANLGCPTGPDEAIACLEAPATELVLNVTLGQALRIRIGGRNGDKGSGTFTLACDDVPVGCPEDCAEPPDGQVDTVDLLALLAQWGGPGSCATTLENNIVDVSDLLALLAAWGSSCE